MNNGGDRVLAQFREISAIPRCSGNEQQLAEWLVGWAGERGLTAEQDEIRNVLIRVPGTGAAADSTPVVLQGHLDMVCEKRPESTHDFTRDAIELEEEGEWLTAAGTTLGADNGIAIAFALALAEDSTLTHPPLELLFTVDEESGLTGAQKLRTGWLRGRTLINIDSEDEGVFTVGCAGGRTTEILLPVTREAPAPDLEFFAVTVAGLQGGHSGVDIHHHRANANVLMARLLDALARTTNVSIAEITGGNAHNAIPRDSRAVLGVPNGSGAVESRVAEFREFFRAEYSATDPGLTLEVSGVDAPESVLDESSGQRVVNVLAGLPHGVIRMSDQVPGLVETSTNLATVKTQSDSLRITTSERSSVASQVDAIGRRVEAVAHLGDGTVRVTSQYPPWEPDVKSALVGHAAAVYERLFGKQPVIEVIHAGLECGVIGAKYPGLEMISVGPTIQMPHSPDERLHLPTVQRVWDLLSALLAEL
jgi:dipeptidase D